MLMQWIAVFVEERTSRGSGSRLGSLDRGGQRGLA